MSAAASKYARDVCSTQSLTDGQRLVLYALATYANRDGDAWPKVSLLAENVGYNRNATQRILRQLEALGIIDGEMRRPKTTRYRFPVMSALDLVEDEPGISTNRAELGAIEPESIAPNRARFNRAELGAVNRASEGAIHKKEDLKKKESAPPWIGSEHPVAATGRAKHPPDCLCEEGSGWIYSDDGASVYRCTPAERERRRIV